MLRAAELNLVPQPCFRMPQPAPATFHKNQVTMTIDATFQSERGGICEALKCHKGWASTLTHARLSASD